MWNGGFYGIQDTFPGEIDIKLVFFEWDIDKIVVQSQLLNSSNK